MKTKEKTICIRCDKEVKPGQNDIFCDEEKKISHIPVYESSYHEIKKKWAETDNAYDEIKKKFEQKDPLIVRLVDMILDLSIQGSDHREVDGKHKHQYGHKFMSSYESSFYFLERIRVIKPVDDKEYWYEVI